MCAVTMVGMEGYVAALVSDQVFVVWREQMHAAASEPSGPAGAVEVEDKAFPSLLKQFISKDGYALTAVIDSKAAPPGEVLEGGGAVAPEVFPGQKGQGILPGNGPRLRKFPRYQCIAFFQRHKVSAAQEPSILGQTDMVREPLVRHFHATFREFNGEIFLEGNPVLGEDIMEDLLDCGLLHLGDEDLVGVHPAAESAQRRYTAQFKHPAQILSRHELPGSAEQVCADDPTAVEVLFKCLCRRSPGPHRHRPAHHPVILCLHRAHPLNQVVRRSELRTDKLLTQQSG